MKTRDRISRVYRSEVGKELDVYCLWPINAPVALGDFGIFNNGVFDKDGNIFQMMGLNVNDFQQNPGGTAVNNQVVKRAASIKRVASAGGIVPAPGMPVQLDIEIDFEGDDAFFLQIQNIRVYSIVYDRVLEQQIENWWSAQPRSWIRSHRLVSRIWNVGRLNFAYTATRKMGVIIKGSAPSIKASAADISFDFNSEVNASVDMAITYPDNVSPFIRTAFYHTSRKRLQTTKRNNKP